MTKAPGSKKHGTYEDGRLDARDEIKREIERRIAIVSKDIIGNRYGIPHSDMLQVARLMLRILSDDLDRFDKA